MVKTSDYTANKGETKTTWTLDLATGLENPINLSFFMPCTLKKNKHLLKSERVMRARMPPQCLCPRTIICST
jgi:hypothetical protein